MGGDGRELLIVEVFYTLQGEGPQAGWPAIFVRLAKCNLRCYFCDTSFEEGKVWHLDTLTEQILTMCSEHTCRLVVLTGGEPLLQNVIPLIQCLNQRSVRVSIETAGTVYLEGLDQHFAPWRPNEQNLIICSPKTPGIHPRIRPLIGAFKYVLRAGEADPDDGLPAMSTQRLPSGIINVEPWKLFRPSDCKGGMTYTPIYLQPMDEGDEEKNKKNMHLVTSLCLKHGYRQSLQTHKIVGLP
jgi:7-carboxy-7-deazaguanine synthase